MNMYETDDLVSQYMAFHYGESHFGVENYPAKCAALCIEGMQDQPREKALDLGCAVGRTTFELARSFDRVTGVDLSSRFIDSANTLKEQGKLGYFHRDEGELGELVQANLEEFGLCKARDKVDFLVEDASALGSHHVDYDLIFAGNLIDRLRDPAGCLGKLHRYLKPGGLLVISSPYTLLTEHTPRAKWIGGFMKDGRQIQVFDGLRSCLEPHFRLDKAPIDVPFVIRETRRKFQHTIAEMSFWRRHKES